MGGGNLREAFAAELSPARVTKFQKPAFEGAEITLSALKANKRTERAEAAEQASLVGKQVVVGRDNSVGFVRDERIDLARLADGSVREIMERREAFLRHQKQNDEFVYSHAGSGDFDPVKIAQKLTDMIIDDLLDDSAKELSKVCDSICESVFEQEFNAPPQPGGS